MSNELKLRETHVGRDALCFFFRRVLTESRRVVTGRMETSTIVAAWCGL